MGLITIIDYESGNVRSVSKAIEFVGFNSKVTHNKEEILSSDGVVLPGVGAFGDCMDKLKKYRLVDVIYKVIEKKKPFLGICVGLHLLFEESEEFGIHKGFGLVKGRVVRFRGNGLKVPHMGWNTVNIKKQNKIFNGIKDNSFFYFVHSYYGVALDETEIASCDYGVSFTAAVNKDNMWGVQFHPEKSQGVGLKLLKNFCDICEGKL
ncbi:imidazole glycerol phosphate synthase subunit HisH [Hippea maritima]|uniref:Imidazole glycerol phosphate synthase subunit HisH n=1 Tax=Hippea maritima (strain ATCC 700847 / DSM 10411 / MH2) TaxID=760142 RepID=F2LTU7_HIPMA|nr:imidazole glycerol phosphate synthase subunit HisH [Hippea maritima]AEA34473.1 Imidazole glycerol phosphate synthase subunit hisH [Hippea maritima DSM 10411]